MPCLIGEQRIRQRLNWFRKAQELGSVTDACVFFGISRKTYYKWRDRYAASQGDRLGLADRFRRPHRHPRRRGRPSTAGASTTIMTAHDALKLAIPVLRYQPRLRPFPATLPAIVYPSGMVTRIGQMPVSREHLVAMNRAMIHRGPDRDGVHLDPHCGLAVRRLSIIDLEGSNPPIYSETGDVCVVMNGEAYNFLELRPVLEAKGHALVTRSDTEILSFVKLSRITFRRLYGSGRSRDSFFQ